MLGGKLGWLRLRRSRKALESSQNLRCVSVSFSGVNLRSVGGPVNVDGDAIFLAQLQRLRGVDLCRRVGELILAAAMDVESQRIPSAGHVSFAAASRLLQSNTYYAPYVAAS